MILRLFKKKSLSDHLRETKKVKVNGVVFQIRKINPYQYLAGFKALPAAFQTYEDSKASKSWPNMTGDFIKKIDDHYREVLLASVVRPKLSPLSPEKCGEDVSVEEVLSDRDLCDKLYGKIMELSYGKKKLNQLQ